MTDTPALPEQQATPGEALPPLPDSAYPPGATPLEPVQGLPCVLVQVTGVDDDDTVALSVRSQGLPEAADIAGILGLALVGLARDGDVGARELLQPDAWQEPST